MSNVCIPNIRKPFISCLGLVVLWLSLPSPWAFASLLAGEEGKRKGENCTLKLISSVHTAAGLGLLLHAQFTVHQTRSVSCQAPVVINLGPALLPPARAANLVLLPGGTGLTPLLGGFGQPSWPQGEHPLMWAEPGGVSTSPCFLSLPT